MKLREFKGTLKGLYNILYRFHNGTEHISNICHNQGSTKLELYSEVNFSKGSLVDISEHGHGIYTRQQIISFIKACPSYQCSNVAIKDIITGAVVPIRVFLRAG